MINLKAKASINSKMDHAMRGSLIKGNSKVEES